MALTMANHLTVIEKAMHRALRLAFRKRLEATPANLAVLASTSYPVYDGVLIYVTSESQIFEWSAASTATPDGVNVIAMPVSAQRPDNTSGRWHRVVSTLTYGPDANALLQNRAAGYCNAVELYEGNATAEDQIERVFAKTPAMLLKWERDAPKRADQRPGRVYWNYLTFTLFIGASNYRNAPAAQVGDAFGKIGIMEMIGDARYFLAGMDNLDPEVDYVEIGPAEVEAEDLKERVFIATLEVTVKLSFNILDRDLVAFAAQVQPKLTNQGQSEQSFDRLNFVGKGYRLAVGPGFTRSYVLGLATVRRSCGSYAAPRRHARGLQGHVQRPRCGRRYHVRLRRQRGRRAAGYRRLPAHRADCHRQRRHRRRRLPLLDVLFYRLRVQRPIAGALLREGRSLLPLSLGGAINGAAVHDR